MWATVRRTSTSATTRRVYWIFTTALITSFSPWHAETEHADIPAGPGPVGGGRGDGAAMGVLPGTLATSRSISMPAITLHPAQCAARCQPAPVRRDRASRASCDRSGMAAWSH